MATKDEYDDIDDIDYDRYDEGAEDALNEIKDIIISYKKQLVKGSFPDVLLATILKDLKRLKE